MLLEIRCDKFRTGSVAFHDGLNVVLGDDNATNSIGKSSLLMVVDFAFGGSSLLKHNKDIVDELGHHDYFFSFSFDDGIYRFRRGTYRPDLIFKCDDMFQEADAIELVEFTAFLKASYGIAIEDITFRTLVGLYARVWGKDNLNVHKPLHIVQNQSPKECVDNLLKTYDRFQGIRELAKDLKRSEDKRLALRKAFKNKIVPKIGKRKYKNNQEKLEKIEAEIEDIKVDLARYATNISEIANREVLDLKLQKDKLLAIELELQSKVTRLQRNLKESRYIKSRHFAGLVQFFPEIDASKLSKVEEFHSGLAKALKSELLESKAELERRLHEVRTEIGVINEQLSATLRSLDNPSVIVDRIYELSSDLQAARTENEYFDSDIGLKEAIDLLRDGLSAEKRKAIRLTQDVVNDSIRRIVSSVFGPARKSPEIELTETNYSYEVFEDTGTGTAYSSLVVLDLAIFSTTELPVLLHDSILFKNIENDSVANLMKLYASFGKQSFVAIDEIDKYGTGAAKMLRDCKVIQLSDDSVLYIKDWRRP